MLPSTDLALMHASVSVSPTSEAMASAPQSACRLLMKQSSRLQRAAGFAKTFFYLEQEVMKPRYEIHSLSIPSVIEPADAPHGDQQDLDARLSPQQRWSRRKARYGVAAAFCRRTNTLNTSSAIVRRSSTRFANSQQNSAKTSGRAQASRTFHPRSII